MMQDVNKANSTLASRFAAQLEATKPDKKPPVIMAIIEIASIISERHRRGYSWKSLRDLLAATGVHTTVGTLRNYIAMIEKAELALRAGGNATPTHREIYEAIRKPTSLASQPQSQLPKAVPSSSLSPQTAGPSRAGVQPAPARGAAHMPITAESQPHSPINHNPNRQL